MKMAAAIPSLAALLAMGCGDSTGSGGTAHVGWIRSNETWTRDGSPHVVRGRLFVGDGAGVTLTIEPGATGMRGHEPDDALRRIARERVHRCRAGPSESATT